MVTPVFSLISFRKAVSVKSVPHTSVQRTQATVKVVSSSAKAAPMVSTILRTSSRESSFFIVFSSFIYVQASRLETVGLSFQGSDHHALVKIFLYKGIHGHDRQ